MTFANRTFSEVYQPALRAAQKALELDDTLAEAHTAMGRIKGREWDWSASEEHLRRAIELNPNYGDAHLSLGTHLARLGRLNEGIAEVKQAIEVDPLSRGYINQLGRLLIYNHQYDEAIEKLQESMEIDPTATNGRGFLIDAYWFNGMHQEAFVESEKADSLQGTPNSQRTRFLRQVASGNRVDAMRTLENFNVFGRALSYARLGETDLAIEWATTAVDQQSYAITWAKVDPFFDPLRDDPRFHDLLP